MSSPTAGPSHSQGSATASQSILDPSPGSPDILEPISPGDPEPDSRILQAPNSDNERLQHYSETFTQTERYDSDVITINESSRESYAASTDNEFVPHNENSVDTQASRPSPIPLNEDTSSVMSLPDAIKCEDSTEEPPAKMRKVTEKSETDEMDGETCPICLDSWGNSGEHRLVALKCGHLFGANCVERWLKAQAARERSCPTCKTKSHLSDIRAIYARRLVSTDTSQITQLQKQLDSVQAQKNRVELELQKSQFAHRACIRELEVLRNTLRKSHTPKEQVRKTWRFALEKNLEIHKDGGCRVLTYNCRTYELYVSQRSTNNLFPGYGIRKASCIDFKLGQYVCLHPKPIRDMIYSQPRDLLLSVGLDGCAKIVERGILSNSVPCGMPLWSCSWDYLRTNEFFVGGVGGTIYQYDLRNPNTFLQRLQAPADISPIVSLCSTEYGLLSCQLNSCWLWVSDQRQWEPKALPIDGPFMSLCYDNVSNRALISCRPKFSGERSRLALCKLKTSARRGDVFVETEQSNVGGRSVDVIMETEHTFAGSTRSTLMSKAAWVRAPGAAWIAAHSESDSTLYLHGLEGARTMSLPAAEPALDVCSVQLNGDTLLAALSESRLRLYKAVATNS